MIKAVLFDIDNTLILFNESDFFKSYFQRITPYFTDYFGGDEFGARLMAASQSLVENQGRMKNVDFFLDRFKAGTDHPHETLWQRYEDFYSADFEPLRDHAIPAAGCSEVIAALKAQGLKLVAASNPLWPLAIQTMRLGWAGLDAGDFIYSTGIENSSHMKPQKGFFEEVAGVIDVAPDQCLMVGNDPLNDMAAKAAGMVTYLTTDSDPIDPDLLMSRRIHAGVDSLWEPDGRGTLAELPAFLRTL